MKSRNHYPGMIPQAVTTVRHYAQSLTRHAAFGPSDLEDLEQELMLDLHRRLPLFDPDKAGLATFIARVVAHCAASLIEKATSAKRGSGIETISLSCIIANNQDGHVIELIEVIPSNQGLWMEHQPSWSDRIGILIDLNHLIDGLSHFIKQIVVQLIGNTVSGIAQYYGVSRSTLYRIISTIRTIFTEAGYQDVALYPRPTSNLILLHFAAQGG